MIILPEAFIRTSISTLEREDKALDGFVSVGFELERRAKYQKWISALKEYYQEHSDLYVIEKAEDEKEFRDRLSKMLEDMNDTDE